MIIIYFSTKPHLALTVCCLHLQQECLRKPEFPDFFLKSGFSSVTRPLKVFGADQAGNIICGLSAGVYSKIYFRALAGVIELFGLNAKIIDVDYLLKVGVPGLGLTSKIKLACGLAMPRFFGRMAQMEIARLLGNYLL